MDVFARAALQHIMKGIQAPAEVKRQVYAEALRLYGRNESRRPAALALARKVWGLDLLWPQANKLLRDEGLEPNNQELAGLLYDAMYSRAYKLERRGQIRSLLAHGYGGYVIEVWIDGFEEPAPCGFANKQTLTPTAEIMGKIPPCTRLKCVCQWAVLNAATYERLIRQGRK